VTIWAENLNVVWGIIVKVSILVVDLKRTFPTSGIDFVPATMGAFISGLLKQIALYRKRVATISS